MALVVKDRVQETTTTSGTGTLTLSAAVSGFQTFSTAIGNGNTTFYTIYDNTAQVWEVGIGTVGAGTLARTTVLSNSSGTTSPINLAGNTASVFCTYPAEKSINYDANDVATIGEVLGYSDTGIIGSFASTVAGYNQVILQNKSTATNASSNFNVSNDAGTAGSNYAELGINSSTFTGSGSFNIAGASYVASASTDLTLGTYGAYNVHFVTNSNTTDAMTIFNDGGISLGGFANPGIANMAASKFVPGYTAVTSAAGTTILTEDSNYYQNLLGTTTQTFQLPDATTLLVGTTFIFDNDSTGALTIVDNASGSIDSIPAGGVDYIYLANNSTVAGTWRKHAFIPASYDFNNSTASFGNASITNAVWNGTTIGTAYGGTGLTSFSAANYALYSTNSSTLTAGTLPVAAGGTGNTTGQAASVANAVTFNNSGSGDVSGTTFDGSAARTISYNTVGAAPSSTVSSQWTTTGSDIYYSTGKVLLNISTARTNFFDDSIYSPLLQVEGTTFNTSSSSYVRNSNDTSAPYLVFGKTRGTTNGSTTIVGNGDPTGAISFQGSDGTEFVETASIVSFVDNTPGANDMPGRLVFSTTADGASNPTERMRIDSSGNVGIGTSSPSALLNVNRTTTGSANAIVISRSSTNNNDSQSISWQATDLSLNYASIGAIATATTGTLTFSTASSSTNTERMRISSTGGLSVGTTADPGAGAIYATGNITSFYTSDIKLKENIKDVDNALDKVCAIGAKTFDWKSEVIEARGGEDGYFVKKSDFGVIAQDVQEVFPQAVRTRDDGTLAVDYEKLAVLSFGAIKELVERINKLEAK